MNTQVEKLKEEVKKNKIKTVYDYFNHRKGDIEKALPKHLNADRMISILTFVIKNNPELGNCTQLSLISAVIQSVQVGLEPNILGHCYFIPYFNSKTKQKEVQFQIGYKGLLELVRRSGDVSTINAQVVYENDTFSFSQGLDPKLEHVPNLKNRGNVIAFYAAAILKDGAKQFEVMTIEDIEKIKSKSKGAGSSFSPWINFYNEMAKKTVLKRLCKLLPISIETKKYIATDETTKKDISEDMINVTDSTDWQLPEPATEEPKNDQETTS